MDFLAILFPKRCVGCRRPGAYVCSRCTSTVLVLSPTEMICPRCHKPAVDGAVHPRCRTHNGLDGLTCFFRYRGVVRSLVHEMKYRLVSDAVSTLVSMIPEAMAASVHTRMGNMPMVLVPIPLAPRRRKLRGFNQAELIAKALGRRWGVPLNTTLLRRVKETIPQVTVEKRDVRFQNMKNAFFAERMKRCDYGVMLCDDVYTTGATMQNAAGALKRAGIKYVWGIAMAR